jgi:aryl-alcohol dehydrogenase-like predicted oxidoreductase
MTQLTYRRLGKTGLKVSNLSFGVATFNFELDQSNSKTFINIDCSNRFII